MEIEYLEHGKFFKDGAPSEFYDLAYTRGMDRHSKDLRTTLQLDLTTPFSKKHGMVSVAFLPVLSKSRYAFVQYQSRFENEEGGSATNRPFFQTRFTILETAKWYSLYENGLIVFPSLPLTSLDTFNRVEGEVYPNINFERSDIKNTALLKGDISWRNLVCAIVSSVLELKDRGTLSIIGLNYKNDSQIWSEEGLSLMDDVLRVLFPITQEPISFAFDSSCSTRTDIRFGAMAQGVGGPSRVIDANASNLSSLINDDVSRAFDMLVDQQNGWSADCYQRYYQEGASSRFAMTSTGGKRNYQEKLLVLTCEITGEYVKWFLKTDGKHDNTIIPKLTDDDIKTILENQDNTPKIRLLRGLAGRTTADKWLEFVGMASLPPNYLRTVLENYLEADYARFDTICESFGSLSISSRVKFQRDLENRSHDILYDVIRKAAKKQSITHGEVVIRRVRYLLPGIWHLPEPGYAQVMEAWLWINPWLAFEYNQTGSLSQIFSKIDLSPSHRPDLFIKAFRVLGINQSNISEVDKEVLKAPQFHGLIDQITDRGASSRVDREVPSAIPPREGYVSIFDYPPPSAKKDVLSGWGHDNMSYGAPEGDEHGTPEKGGDANTSEDNLSVENKIKIVGLAIVVLILFIILILLIIKIGGDLTAFLFPLLKHRR